MIGNEGPLAMVDKCVNDWKRPLVVMTQQWSDAAETEERGH